MKPVELNETESTTASENEAVGIYFASTLFLYPFSTPGVFDLTISAIYELLRIVKVFDGVLFVFEIEPE